MDADAARALLEQHLEERLLNLIGDGQAARMDYSSREEGGMLIVTLLAECSEQVGRTIPMAEQK
ncbi:hypothetical protein SDC9_154501 [bioreactor metagenome]|uniref:Uncharacterized protein n=1 Tax=bioreactor metagenome TaxID=1076179 RepID=A0A645EYV3_9ZZZZ